MIELPKVFKEIIPESSQNDQWKDVVFNSGGTPSTLQDIKVMPHSGGYAYSELPNRFIYWRTNYDVLEIIEQSLDSNLCGNQVRCKFQNAPILDGITIHERGNTVVMLIPTVSSVHRLNFVHPAYERNNTYHSTSIFSDITSELITNPTSYHLFSTMPYLPHSAASVLADDEDNAIFCLALNNNSILLVKLQRLTGMASTNYLKLESGSRKRFLSGLTEVLLGAKQLEDNTISLALEKYEKDIFLFALNRNGRLRVWCCNKMQCINEYDFTASNPALIGAQYSVLRKKLTGSNLIFAVYSSSPDYSRILVLRPFFKKENIIFDTDPLTYTAPVNVDLIEMKIDCDGQVVLCIWRSRDSGETTIAALSLNLGRWSLFEKDEKLLDFVNNGFSRTGTTAREYYLNLIFAPGMFSVSDIKKVLNIYKGTPQLEHPSEKLELRVKVCAALEMEIQAEALEYELSDEDYVNIAERCWNKFYLNCFQYQETGKVPCSLFWLPSAMLLVVVSKSNLSFFRTVEVLEETLVRPDQSNESQSYKHLMNILSDMQLNDEQNLRYNRAVRGFHSLKETTAEIAAEFKLQNILNSEIDAIMKYQDLQTTLRNLSDVLFMPETFEHSGDYCNSFRGDLGVQILYSTVNEVVKTRFLTCRNLALLLQILDSIEIKKDFLAEILNLCRAYAILNWCCETVVPNNTQMISLMQFFLNKPDLIVQSMLLDTVWSTLQYLWPLTNSINLAEYLLLNKQNILLISYSRMVTDKVLHNLRIQNFLEINEPYKAFDLVKEVAESPESCLKMIKMFEQTDQSDIVVNLAELGIEKAKKMNHPDLPTLYSILFLHHLKLGQYDLAFVNMDKNPERSRRVDCLRELIITLMNSKEIDKLLNFPYDDLLPYLESIMEQRARSLQSQQAAPYYNFLYALHVRKENFRKAARVMFEQACRSEDNKQQMLSYATCLNCLSLVNPDHAWVLKPKSSTRMDIDDDEDSLEIYELQDLTKEFELASARSKLINCPPDVSAYEVVMKLISASRYRLALKISSLFQLELEPTLEALAAACTRITEDPDPWSWLVENDISDFIIGDENAVVVAWRLLEALLLKYEEPRLTSLHRVVACKIMSLDVVLPYWLEVSYKKRNPGELLRLYLKYGELVEASRLCCEFVAAMLGKGKEMFDIEDAVGVTSSVKCLPINAVDILLLELQNQQMNDLYEDVKIAISIYLGVVQRVTNDKTRYNRNNDFVGSSFIR